MLSSHICASSLLLSLYLASFPCFKVLVGASGQMWHLFSCSWLLLMLGIHALVGSPHVGLVLICVTHSAVEGMACDFWARSYNTLSLLSCSLSSHFHEACCPVVTALMQQLGRGLWSVELRPLQLLGTAGQTAVSHHANGPSSPGQAFQWCLDYNLMRDRARVSQIHCS